MTENEIHFRNTDDCIKKIKRIRTMYRDTTPSYVALSDSIQVLEEIQQYRAIGTVEEFKALKEKSVAKKVVRQKGALNKYYHEEECPNCKAEFRVHVAGYKYTQAVGETHYCPNCGQKLDWK